MNDNLLQLKQAFADEGYDDEDATNPKTTIMATGNTRDDCSDLTDTNNDHAEEQPNKSFPQRLLDILSNEAHADVISWLPHGTGFQIHKKKTFAAEILPIYFKASKFTSFTRKLNRWGFTRVPRGPETGAYFHKLFRRDKPELCLQMTSNSGNKYQANPLQQSLFPSMPGMMPPGMPPPPMFPFMNPMMAAAAAASTNANGGNMTPQQQQQVMWQQQMHQMMMFQQQQMMQQMAAQNSSAPFPPPMMGMPPQQFPNMQNNNTTNTSMMNMPPGTMNPATTSAISSTMGMPSQGQQLMTSSNHDNNIVTNTKPPSAASSSVNNNVAGDSMGTPALLPVMKQEEDVDDDDDDNDPHHHHHHDDPGLASLGNHSLADDVNIGVVDAGVGGNNPKTV